MPVSLFKIAALIYDLWIIFARYDLIVIFLYNDPLIIF